MNPGESVLLKILSIPSAKREKAKDEILHKLKHLVSLQNPFTKFEDIVHHLDENKDNDKVNDYIEKITEKDEDLKFKNLNELLTILLPDLEEARQKLEKLQKLNPLVSFLSNDCKDNIDREMNELLEEIANLQAENQKVRSILDIDKEDKPIKKLFNINSAYTLPSNVFYRFSIQKLFKDSEIKSMDSLFDNISNIQKKTENLININMIKNMKVQEFKEEIIQKTQDLMKSEETKIAINSSRDSNQIYQRIESNYLEFSKLSNDDKEFLQKTTVQIIHFNDFTKLGLFFDKYFKSKVSNPDQIKCIIKILMKDDKAIQIFQEFSNQNNDNSKFLNAKIDEINNLAWPMFNIVDTQQASQFFTFWNCINQIISLHIENNESLLLSQICSFLDDKNTYTQFQKKMQQAYIEPRRHNILIIFSSIMKMLSASDIANNKADFETVSKKAAAYFANNPSEFYKVSNDIDTLIKNEKQIIDLFSNNDANAVIEEYNFVKKVVDKELTWKISFKDHIRLMNKNKIEADFVKLRLIAAKLNIVMIRTNNISNSEECKNSEDFVKFFQTAESLYEKLSILHKLNFEIGNKEITHDSLDSYDLQKSIANLDKVIQAINKVFSKVYTDSICLFTKEQFFALYQLLNKYSKNQKEKSPDLVSIFEGTIISTYIERTDTPVDDYYKLIKEKFKSFEFNDDFSDKNIKKFEDNLTSFSEIIRNINTTLLIKENLKNIDEYSNQLEAKGNLNDYLEGGTVRCINSNTNKNEKNAEISSKYQLHSMILYLFKSYKSNDSLPFPTQLLICSMSTTLSQIDSFLGYFHSVSKIKEKQMFIVVSPIQLQPALYDYLITKLKDINETTVTQSRIVILFENDDLTKKDIFKDVIRSINVDSFKPICNTAPLKNLYKIKKESTYGIQAYYIYESFPRTGKTHTILKHIHENYPNHIYTRILVDESTTLTTLINRLNEIHKIDSKDNKIIIHLNVDGKCNTDFHLYIQNLAFFRSLNDGISIPFLTNNNMVFYFEFGSRPSFGKSEFIQNVFPIADYIEEIKVEQKTEEFFTYDEYHTIPHKEIAKALMVIKKEKYRRYLIDAATIARLNQDDESFLNVNKSAMHVRYSDYIDNYLQYYDELENNPKLAYEYLLRIFKKIKDVPKEFEKPLISQIGDVSKILSKFKGPIISQQTYGKEAAVGYNVRRFLVGLLIDAAITNCGLPYIPPLEGNKVVESSEEDQERIKKIKEFITKGHMLAVCDPAGNQEEQSFTLICNETNDFDDLMKEFKYYDANKEKYAKVKDAIKTAMNVIDSEWRKNQDSPDILFEIFANILSLSKYEEKKYNVTMIVNIWRSLKDESRKTLDDEWKKYIETFKKNVKLGSQDHVLELNAKYHVENDDPEFKRQKNFWDDVQNEIIKQSPFDISDVENKQSNENKVFVSNDIYTFISNCEKYIQNEDSLMLKYTLTPQNIMRFIHLVYRIYSHVPIVLMGETGSGKTFTLNFLSEIIGSNVKLVRRVIDGGTKEEDIRSFLRVKINELDSERSKVIKARFRAISEDTTTPISIADVIKSLPIGEKDDVILTNFEDIANIATEFIDNLDMKKLNDYDITNEAERESFKDHVMHNLSKIYQKIEMDQKTYLFFFDEVNTAPCQWFIKEIILDRYFEGKILPNNIHFVCAVNPSRKLKGTFGQNALDALDPIYSDDSQDERKDLVYKVGRMPESFVPYLFPADPNREYGSFLLSKDGKKDSDEDYLFDVNINSEFDVSIDKKVESEFSLITYQFVPQNKDANKDTNYYLKEGDKHHFSSTNMFSTSFDYSFFYKLTNNSQNSLSYGRAISRILSRINIFCCRFSYKEIYHDVSFSSIRDPERCIQIMRWAYKFGIFEKLKDDLSLEEAIKRLRKAFIIGLSVSFWIRLSDQPQKDKNNKDSHRKMFINSVCKYWQKVLEKLDIPNEIKTLFKEPSYKEWIEMISNECKQYVNIFVDDDECVSKNNALSENIWVSFICIMNNIPLWIIGKPGTSKSLALNIVINKLMNQNSTNEKITKCPPIVQQTFMCSNTTTTEAIMDQLGKIVDRSMLYKDNYIIRIQVLEEIGHADMSRFKPLVCLHNIIDNGYTIRPGTSIPVHLIGLSNYKMDSAKLNRGILLLRCSLNEDDIKQTAFEIFKSTNLALNPDSIEGTKKYNELIKHKKKIEEIGKEYQNIYESLNMTSEKPFMGLRDFYGLIQSITKNIVTNSKSQTKILTIIRRNYSGIPYSQDNLDNEKTTEIIKSTMKIIFPDQDFDEKNHFKKLLCPIKADKDERSLEKMANDDIEHSTVYYDMTKLIQANLEQEHRLLKTPIFRHILISTTNAAAIFILVQNGALKFTNYDKDSPYEFFFSNNMTNIPDAEWISNELRRLTEVMYEGRKTAIFIGKHPCFDSLYDIFNLRYQKEGGGSEDDKNENFVAMVAYGGDSYPIIVNSNFKAIIIIESNAYKDLPQPFLNRFEKFNLSYETELLEHHHDESRNKIKSLKRKLQKDPSLAFGCYSDELILSIYHTCEHTDEIDIDNLMLLSIHPAELVYSITNDLSFSDDDIISTLKENSKFRSSIAHLLSGYNDDTSADSSISGTFYKNWKKATNKGIKSIIMVPSFNNINKISGYDFIKIDSSNSVNIESRFKDEVNAINEKTKKVKKPNPIVLSILISQGKFTIDHILQYEYTLESIRRWCRDELKITNRPIHMLIIISMEHKIEGLKVNQSTEWPLIYLDTCYDDTILTKNNDGLPLSLEQIVFTPLKSLLADEIIDLEGIIKLTRKSIHPYYTKEENELIDNLIFNHEGNYQTYIFDLIKSLISDKDDDKEEEEEDQNNNTRIETISNDILDLWSIKKVINLSSPPSSLIEFLSLKLIDALGRVMSIVFELLLSGINPNDIENVDKKIFQKSEIFYNMLYREEFTNIFYNIFNSDSTEVYPIDYRYNYIVELPGQLSFYKFVWQTALNINNTENIEDSDILFDEVKKALFKKDQDDIVTSNFEELMKAKLSSSETSISFTFIAAYLLVIADSVHVDSNHYQNFLHWISCFIEILKGLYNNNKALQMKFVMYILVSNKELLNLAQNLTISFMFFPNPISKNTKTTQSNMQSKLKEFYNELVPGEIKKSIKDSDTTEKMHIYSEAAYLITQKISKEIVKTLDNLNIDIIEAVNLFRHEFPTLLAIHVSLLYCGIFINNEYKYEYESICFSFVMVIQKFFADYGNIILKTVNPNDKIEFNIKSIRDNSKDNYDFSKIEDVEKFISYFVKYYFKKTKINELVDEGRAISSLTMYFYEAYYNVYLGTINEEIDDFADDDAFDGEEEEEEEEAPDED